MAKQIRPSKRSEDASDDSETTKRGAVVEDPKKVGSTPVASPALPVDPLILHLRYNLTFIREETVLTQDISAIQIDTSCNNWINVAGLTNQEAIAELGRHLSYPQLALEDALHTQYHPKLEEYKDCLYVILKFISLNQRSSHHRRLHIEHVSLLIRPGQVVSIHEESSPIFDVIRAKLHDGDSRLRASTADYLLYSLFDAIVDNYLIVLETLSQETTALNSELLNHPGADWLKRVHLLRHDFLVFRTHASPVKDILSTLIRCEFMPISESTKLYFRDVSDHINFLLDEVFVQQEMLTGLFEVYLSLVNQKTNQIMKILTIMTSLFIPMTFITSIYGMNFRYIPELEWKYGYPALLLILLVVAVGMLWYFRHKGLFDEPLFRRPRRTGSKESL
jgi:magnesium transporter